MNSKKLKKLHSLSMHNRQQIDKTTLCGCFNCLETFNPQETPIQEWIDDNDTALCPFCGTDSIIPETTDNAITRDILSTMKKKWF